MRTPPTLPLPWDIWANWWRSSSRTRGALRSVLVRVVFSSFAPAGLVVSSFGCTILGLLVVIALVVAALSVVGFAFLALPVVVVLGTAGAAAVVAGIVFGTVVEGAVRLVLAGVCVLTVLTTNITSARSMREEEAWQENERRLAGGDRGGAASLR